MEFIGVDAVFSALIDYVEIDPQRASPARQIHRKALPDAAGQVVHRRVMVVVHIPLTPSSVNTLRKLCLRYLSFGIIWLSWVYWMRRSPGTSRRLKYPC